VITPRDMTATRAAIDDHPRAKALLTPELLPFAQATNLGASRARAELLLLLNDDTVVEEQAIERLVTTLDGDPRLGAVAPLLLNPDGSIQPSVYADPSWRTIGELIFRPLFVRGPLAAHSRFPYSRAPDPASNEIWLSGAALMIRRTLFEYIGALDEAYSHGIEDAALCRSVRERGFKIALVRRARIVHEGGVSGFRADDNDRLCRVLLGGTNGWIRYWEAYRGGGATLVRAAFVVFGLSRLVAFTVAGLVPGERHTRSRLKRDVYRRYVRAMISPPRRAD
jgi:N-acetylglucosaminyl-diphospho-decaprenol L-rhamnosyltransferase